MLDYRYHMEVTDGPRGGRSPGIIYMDWNEDSTWTVTGTFGPCKGRNGYEQARNFYSPDEAKRFYEPLYGDAVEFATWPAGQDRGGRWGLRFRNPKPETVAIP